MKTNYFIKLLLFVALGAALILAAVWGYFIYRDVDQVENHIKAIRDLKNNGLMTENLPEVCDLAGQTSISVGKLKSDLGLVLGAARALEGMPGVGGAMRQPNSILNYLDSLSQAGEELCQAGLPLWEDLSQANYEVILDPTFSSKLTAAEPNLINAEKLFGQAWEDTRVIDIRMIPNKYQNDYAKLNAYIPLVLRSLVVARELPAALDLVDESVVIQKRGLDTETIAKFYSLSTRAVQITSRLKTEIQSLPPVDTNIDPGSRTVQYLYQVEPVIIYLDTLAQAGVGVSQMALSIMDQEASQEGETTDAQLELINQLIQKQSDINQAKDLLDRAVEARGYINTKQLPAAIQSRLDAVDRLLMLGQSGMRLFQVLPDLAGVEKPQTYLILVQNRDELRGTGGFITAFGLLHIDHGQISIDDIKDSIPVNDVAEEREIPEALAYLMQASYLVSRDANWSPDYPTSATEIQAMYPFAAGIISDGVIAIDQRFLASLLEIFGPLPLPDVSGRIDADNLQAVLAKYKDNAIESGSPEKRKNIIIVLGLALADKIKETNQPQQQIKLAKLLYQQMGQGHLQVYFNDLEAQKVLHQLGMDGAVNPGEGDFLMLVDSNVNFSKVDAFIQRSMNYHVNLSDPQNPSAAIRLRYQHTQAGTEPCHQGLPEPQNESTGRYYYSRCYWDYWRLLQLDGTQLRSAQFDPVPATYFDDNKGWKNEVETSPGENRTQVFAGLVVVPQGDAKEVVVNTQLPENVLSKPVANKLIYRLRIQKQAGIEFLPVELQVSCPSGYFLSSAPSGWSYDQAQNLATWKGAIYEMQDFLLEFTQ
jgi:hypothetical protein